MKWTTFLPVPAALALLAFAVAADPPSQPTHRGPLTPDDERATFHLPKGLRAELVACEPNVIDPVAIAFDEDGRLYVAEMPGYPNGGVATGTVSSGRIKLLEDRDGDGYYETATTFADHLRFPTSVMAWKNGVLAAVAPDLVYLEDTDGDGKADRRRVLYTGFDLANIQQLLSGFQWGLDNWVYAGAGGAGGTITCPEKPDSPPVSLHGRGVRFHPDRPGSLEPTSGGGQFGLAADEWQRWFVNTNSQHLRHIVLPDHYLRRNPSLPVAATTLDIPDHGAACKVHRLSPFEAWRVERTQRRQKGPEAKRLPPTELVPGGFVTSGCGPVVYLADRLPEAYRGNTFICDPANNLVHRDLLVPHGATFVAKRAEADTEFLASPDNWFRPVNLAVGPDGGLYLVDFYREVIETPLSLPDDIKSKLNLESRGRGRIWRIVPEGTRKAAKPALRKASTAELVGHLDHPNVWWRLTAQRLLVERQDRAAKDPLRYLARNARTAPGRAHALWTLRGLNALDDDLVEQALLDPEPGVREQGLRLADERLRASAALRKAVAALAEDPSPRVRFQLAFTLGEADAPELVAALAKVARRDVGDPWTETAVLSSAARTAPALLAELARDREFTGGESSAPLNFLTRLAALVGARGGDAELAQALRLLDGKAEGLPWRTALLTGLGQGMQNGGRSLSRLWADPPAALKATLARVQPLFAQAAAAVRDGKLPVRDRVAAARLLAFGPTDVAAPALREVLTPLNPADLQLAAVRALSAHDDRRVSAALLAPWNGYSPVVRREVVEALFARPDRLAALLDAVGRKEVLAGQIEPSRLDQLRNHADPEVRRRAKALLAGRADADRKKVLDDYRAALDLAGDAARGRAVFRKTCATCHRLENEGTEVGPDLLSALRTKTREGLLIDILDPSRDVDPRYVNYVLTTKAGRQLTGMIAAETASSITLRRADRAEDTVLRGQVEEVQATAKSVMPEGLEMQLGKQDVADVIAYLLAVAGGK